MFYVGFWRIPVQGLEMIQKIDHIGIAVKSIEKAREYFENTLGLKCEGVETVESRRLKRPFTRLARCILNYWSRHPKRALLRNS
jgi:hypothetical protein